MWACAFCGLALDLWGGLWYNIYGEMHLVLHSCSLGLMILRIYLDNCCYNRPYDDQSQLRISLESQAKVYIQNMIRNDELELATSFVLTFENSKNRVEEKRNAIASFMEEYSSIYISGTCKDRADTIASEIMATGVKSADALHTACAIIARCDYMLTTDDRLLKYRSDKIRIVNPTEFIMIIGGIDNDR